jgi:hypothetical protein
MQSHQPNDALTTMLLACSTPLQVSLVREMYLTAVNAKTEVDPHLSREFLREFASQSPEAISWAFHEWRASSKFQPAISDVWQLLDRYREKRRIDMETEKRQEQKRADREERERRLAAGDREYSYADIREMLFNVVKKMDEVKIAPERREQLRKQVGEVSKRKARKKAGR